MRSLLVVAAATLGLTAGTCAATGAPAPDRPTPSPPECRQELTVGHVPGHVDRVWELACAD